MQKALELTGLPLLLECINILSLMSVSHNITLLNREDSESSTELVEADARLVKVLSFIKREYYHHLTLSEIAAVAGMNKSAFCRFFIAKTGKTCTEYITSLRINYACKLLLEGKLTITEICYECGFNNISNFNRHFKRITNYSPTKYLMEFNKTPLHKNNYI